jgi:YD repeat-containing protein
MRLSRSLSSAQFTSLSLLLTYSLAISLFAPFAIKRVEAVSAERLSDVSARKSAINSVKASAPVVAKQQEQKVGRREGELLVRFREHAPAQKMNALLRSNSAQWNGQLRGVSSVERLRLAEGSNPEAVASIMRSSELIEFAEPNYLITADQSTSTQTSPDDPRFSEQWALKDTGASLAWSKTTGSKQTVIAVIDSGIDFTHPDLINNQWDNTLERADGKDEDGNNYNDDLHGWDFVANSAGIVDEQGHGTAVAGIIAAQGNNSIGITGMMWHAGLMSLRVLDKTGTGDVASAVEAIDYATMNGAQVINCSWGTEHRSEALLEAISRADKRGVVVITSAGNNSRDIETTPHYPASYELPNLIAVASTDNSDQLASFSNWGERHVSITAPGTEILTTKLGGDYQTISGSSASTPFVSSMAGLIKTLRPWLGADRTREMILSGARPVPSLKDKVASKGVVSAAGALAILDALPPNEGLDEGSGNNGGEHGTAPDSGENNRGGRPSNRATSINPDRFRNGDEFKMTPPARTQGVPSSGLPNLDELKRKQPTNPKAIDPVPSTRCSHKGPDCASERRKASLESHTGLLAWGGDTSRAESLVTDSSQAISDSPFRLFWSSPSLSPASMPQPQPQTPRTNFALASNGGVATASSALTGYSPDGANNGDRRGLNWGSSGGWADSTVYTFPDWIQIDFDGPKSIDEIDVFGIQDNYQSPSEPTAGMTWTLYGLSAFQVQYWNGTSWLDVPAGNITSNNLVWRQLTFSPITTSKIRVVVNNANGYSRVIELEAYGPTPPPRTNVALAANGGTVIASSSLSGFSPGGAINGDRKGLNLGNDGVWADSTVNTFPDWLQIDFNGAKTIDEVDLFGVQDNYQSPIEPTAAMTFSLYGLPDFQLQYLNGTTWTNIPNTIITSNNLVWKKLTFTAITTTKLRVVVNNANGYSRVSELEVYGIPAPVRTNVALAANGGVATASSALAGYSPDGAINGDRKGLNWSNGGGWADATVNAFPDWLQVDFNNSKTIDEIDVFGVQDNYQSPVEPTITLAWTLYGLPDFQVQYWSGSAWITVPGGSVSGNNLIWRQFTFSPITTNKIRVVGNNALYGHCRITELEAYGTDAGTGGTVVDYSAPRVDPVNQTGTGGVDLLSGNANWSLPILGLKGRAGLDLGISLSYNSLVWTKSQDGASIKFDADRGTPSPGFRLGFPTIDPLYYNQQVGRSAYLLITPSGSHMELRQVGSTNDYDSADSSYLRLTDNGGGSLTLRPPDGSELSYNFANGQYHCVKIKDRNGNYITVSYYSDGRINAITDTLARVVTFNYDVYFNLISITQDWGGTTHTWATFGWSNLTIQTSFANSLSVVGPQNGAIVPVLMSVGLGDGTYYKFRYNSWGQVDKLTSYAADSQQNGQMLDTHLLNYNTYILNTSAGSNDCPRVTETRVSAEYWSGQNNVPAEVVTQYAEESGGVHKRVAPDGTVYKEFYGTGWQKGLVIKTEYWTSNTDPSPNEKKKWTETSYTQSNTNLSYQQNPRVTETNIYDKEGNRKRVVIEYGTQGSVNEQWSLPSRVIEYAADGTTEIRHTFTGYNLDPAYLSQRIIGLVSAVHVSDTQTWQSIVYYDYDAGGEQLAATINPTIQHDNVNYGTTSPVRGNLTKVTRYDAADPNNVNKRVATQIGYNTNGSVIFTKDPLDHQSTLNYADSFSDTSKNSLNTYAYPTTATDPDGYAATSKYNYEFGAVTWSQDPPPQGFTSGAVQTFEYDGAGRISRVNNLVNNAYKQWVYDDAGHVSVKTKIETGGQETVSTTVFDGLGRVRGTSSENPNSHGLYSAQYTYYDQMGRVFKKSNPTEVTSLWAPDGDDSAGWVWTLQAYDWKGRPTVTTNPDGTTKKMTYGGCGCAGGEVVTVEDEMGRRQRVTSDVLGRQRKTETLKWDGTTVYSATTNSYNALDKVTGVYEEGENVTAQTTTLTYDGHGRLKTKQAPSQTSATTYSYNADDTPHSVTDARGVVSTFTYNNRHQTTGISYTTVTGIAHTANVTIGYDAVGNRTSMTDGSGSVTYHYDQLSRLSSEGRTFTAPPNEVAPPDTYILTYGYNLAGELTSIEDPDGNVINYVHDKTGRVTDITGTSFGNITQYATNIRQRAWGALKSASYGDDSSLTANYNSRLQPTDFAISGLISKHYEYYNDGKLRYSRNDAPGVYDRSYTYDYSGRVTEAFSGPLARGEADVDQRPYKLTYQYDSFGHLTSRSGNVWNAPTAADSGSGIYANNKNTGWSYDADGRLIDSVETQYTFDAAGRAVNVVSVGEALTQEQVFDGDGQRTKLRSQQDTYHEDTYTWTSETKTQYFVTSSVLGKVITELDQTGHKTRTFVYQGGEVLAWQQKIGTTENITWEHRDASNATVRFPGILEGEGGAELEPMGSAAPTHLPLIYPWEEQSPLSETRTYPALADMLGGRCTADGVDLPCEMVGIAVRSGAATVDPNSSPPDTTKLPGVIPIYGKFCGGIAGDPISDMICSNEVTGYTVLEALGNNGLLIQAPQQTAPLPNLRSGIDELLRRSDCGNFVQSLLNQVAKSTQNPFVADYPLDIFDQAKFEFKQAIVRGKEVGGTVKGSIIGGDAKIIISPIEYAAGVTRYGKEITAYEYVESTLHEIIHLAASNGTYSDRQLAQAVFDFGGLSKADRDWFRTIKANDLDGNSIFFDHALQSHCPSLAKER